MMRAGATSVQWIELLQFINLRLGSRTVAKAARFWRDTNDVLAREFGVLIANLVVIG